MKQNSIYFPHDQNSMNDPKCAALIKEMGLEGYGFFWAVTEILHEQGGKIEKFPKLFEGLAARMNTNIETVTKQIEALLNGYNLLKQDEKFIWSERVLRNLDERKEKYQKRASAGRLGGIESGKSRSINKNEALLEANEANEANEMKGKEIKGNERKGKKPFVQPSVEDVTVYFKELNCSKDPQEFYDYYASKGWLVGKSPMRDWRAAARRWCRSEFGDNGQKGGSDWWTTKLNSMKKNESPAS